jgi:nucleoside triphosphate diphosphatase
VFHARLAEEAGAFDFATVAEGICAKMLRRHPHVFGDRRVADSVEQSQLWEEIKRDERLATPVTGVLGGIPAGLPALTRAVKLGKRAATVGFDWPDTSGVRAKVVEELAEIDAAVADGDATAMAAEMGDLLLTIASWCRHLGLDPESCARSANARFERRFRAVESRVATAGRPWAELNAAALDELWRAAKAEEP